MALSLVRGGARARLATRLAPARRWSSTMAAEVKPPSPSATATAKQPSMLPRAIAFSVFSLFLGAGAATFTIATDDSKLFWARDKIPWFVNAVAPLIGIPQEINQAELIFKADDDENGPTDIKQVVGDVVYVAAKMASGRIHIVECDSYDADEAIANKVFKLSGSGDRVVEISTLDPARAKELAAFTPDELFEKLNSVKIPDIPEVITLHSLGIALELCRQLEIDLEVRLRLSPSEATAIALKRGLEQIDERKKVLKKMIKEEKKRQGIGFLASMFKRY